MSRIGAAQSDLLAEPSARTFPLAQLVASVREGTIRVPHFQRGLRWTTADAVALIDSVLRGFPIGSLLLWRRKAPAETLRLGNVTIDAPELTDALYVVDGQQRITTFLNVFDPIQGLEGEFALVYDLKQRPFKVRPRTRHDSDDRAIPLPVLFDLSRLLRWVSEHPDYAGQIDQINAATQRLREFHVPAYEVRSDDDHVLREIYDRMNNTGKRLSRAEAFWGLFAPDENATEATTFATIQKEVYERLGWGQLDLNTILHAFLARRGPDIFRDIHLEFREDRRKSLDFPSEDQEEAHQNTLRDIERAIRFLRTQADVPHFSFLAYRYLLVVLTRFFAHFPDPDPRNLELLKRWYWRAALAGTGIAGGSATGAARTLASCIRPGDESGSVQQLLATVKDKPEHRPSASDYRSNRASGHIMLCALWAQEPRSPDTSEPFEESALALEIEKSSSPRPVCQEIFPRTELNAQLRNSLGNRVIAPGITFEVIESLLTSSEPVRASHFLTDNSALTPDEIVRERESALQAGIDAFLKVRTAHSFDDSPPLETFDLDDEVEEEGDSGEFVW